MIDAALASLTSDTRDAVSDLMDWSAAQGVVPVVMDALRTCDEQNALYAQGRTAPGRVVTGTPGCKSWHTHGRAVDLYIGTWQGEAYRPLGEQWEAMGGRWGGRFRDYGHFEWHGGHTLDELCPYSGGACPSSGAGLSRAGMAAGLGLGAVGIGLAWMMLRN